MSSDLAGIHETSTAIQEVSSEDEIIKVLMYGDLSSMTQKQKAEYLYKLAKKQGLDPISKPFDIIPLQGGKLTVYANKGAAAQLQAKHQLSVEEISAGFIGKDENAIYQVKVKVTSPGSVSSSTKDHPSTYVPGRVSYNVGCASLFGLKAEMLSNKIMACHTKAIRRAVLVHCGLGFMDESELDSVGVGTKWIGPATGPSTAQLTNITEGQSDAIKAFTGIYDAQKAVNEKQSAQAAYDMGMAQAKKFLKTPVFAATIAKDHSFPAIEDSESLSPSEPPEGVKVVKKATIKPNGEKA